MGNYTIPQNVYQPTITVTNDDDSKRYMIVREIGGGERTVIRPGITCRFKVPYQGLVIGYAEPKRGSAE